MEEKANQYEGLTYGGGDILEDLLIQNILPRLPVNQLFKFKLVCKNWRNCIAEDSFITIYNSYNNPTNCLTSSCFYYYSAVTESVISLGNGHDQFRLSTEFLKEKSHITGSTNGLLYGLCLEPLQIFVCNPITKQAVIINNPSGLMEIALAYDPHNNNDFGSFKIIDFYRIPGAGMRYQFKVYSSMTGEWHTSRDWNVEVPLFQIKGSVYNRGKVYWVSMKNTVWFDVERDAAGVVPCPWFDVEGDASFIPFPDMEGKLEFLHPLWLSIRYFELGVCKQYDNGGEISCSMVTAKGDIKIWLLKNAGGDELKWVIKHSVRLQRIFEQNCDIMLEISSLRNININGSGTVKATTIVYPLPYVGGEVVWFRIWHFRMERKLFSINIRTGGLKWIDFDCSGKVWPFIPTLLPV